MLEQEADENMVIPQPYCPNGAGRCGMDRVAMGLLMVSHYSQTLAGYGAFRFDIEYERL